MKVGLLKKNYFYIFYEGSKCLAEKIEKSFSFKKGKNSWSTTMKRCNETF